jgi:hypothetical protein
MELIKDQKIKGKVFDPRINIQGFRFGGNTQKVGDLLKMVKQQESAANLTSG